MGKGIYEINGNRKEIKIKNKINRSRERELNENVNLKGIQFQ